MLVADPLTTLTTRGDSTQISSSDVVTSTNDPLALLERELNALPFSATTDPDLPFQGGALGLFGYDLG
ncbi:aminodeoxychorismate synthase component I, partial [Priestia aryabhattai]